MRIAETDARNAKYPKTLVRVRCPDESMIECTFLSSEKIAALHEIVASVLDGDRTFELFTTPPLKVLDNAGTFWDEDLAPACLVYIRSGDKDKGSGELFSEEWRGRMRDHPVVDQAATGKMDVEMEEVRSAQRPFGGEDGGGKSKGKPKWFKIGK
jgi:hypothetical protein